MRKSEVSLRSAEAPDAACLSSLATQVFFETYATSGIRPALVREAESHYSVPVITRKLSDPLRRTVLAERDGHLVAFVEVVVAARHHLLPPGSAVELSRLYVLSAFIRQGVGSLLLKRAEALAATEGALTLWLTAWVGNKRALEFYASQGYAQLGVTEYTFEGEVFDNLVFAKALRQETGALPRAS